MKKDLDTTYYRFLSEVKAFLSKLLKNPVDAQPSKYLKDRDFTRKKLIDELLKRDVIERHEKILDRTNSDEKDAKYVVKFKVHKKDFEKRIHRIYIKYFEKNVNESVFANEEDMKKKILSNPIDKKMYMERGGMKLEEDGAGAGAAGAAAGGEGGGFLGGATAGSESTGEYDVPFGMVERRPIGGRPKEKEKGKKIKPENILGKTVYAECKKCRRIFVTEEQMERIIQEELGGATTTVSVGAETTRGDMGYDVPFLGGKGKGKANKFMKPAMDRKPGFSVERLDEE